MEDIKGYDDWKQRQPVEVIVASCEHCGEAIYMEETCYKTNQGVVHEDCFEEFSIDFLDASLTEGFGSL